jgi:hypothetical protein
MNDFELGGRKFKIGKLNVFKQFHVVRRIAPVLADMLPVMGDLQKATKNNQKSEDEKFQEVASILAPILKGFSKLSDQDSEFVLYGLLSAVEVQLGNSWTKIATDNLLMVQDFDLPALLQIAGRSFMANLSNFFAVLPQASPMGK